MGKQRNVLAHKMIKPVIDLVQTKQPQFQKYIVYQM